MVADSARSTEDPTRTTKAPVRSTEGSVRARTTEVAVPTPGPVSTLGPVPAPGPVAPPGPVSMLGSAPMAVPTAVLTAVPTPGLVPTSGLVSTPGPVPAPGLVSMLGSAPTAVPMAVSSPGLVPTQEAPSQTTELLASMVHQARTLLQPAYDALEGITDDREGVVARASIRRMLKFTEKPLSVVAFISEAKNALVPARYHLCKINKLPQAEAARVAIQSLLDFVTGCAAKYEGSNRRE